MMRTQTMRHLLTSAVVALLATGTAGLTAATEDSDASGWERLELNLENSEATDDPLPVVCETGPEACDLGQRAAASLPYPWDELGYVVVIAEPIDSWHAGRTLSSEQRIELFVDEDSQVRSLTSTLAHEIGHAIHQRCNDPLLTIWSERRELPPGTPDHVEAPHDYDSAGEDFAEAFAQYLGYGPSRSTVGPTVTQVWLEDNADLFEADVCETLE